MLRAAFAVLLLSAAAQLGVANTQPPPAPRVIVPTQVKLADVEIRLAYRTHGGCHGRCIAYQVLVRGDGVVRYEDIGGEPRDPVRQRTVPTEDVIELVNDILRARFFEAAAEYDVESIAVRDGDSLRFMARGGVDGPEWYLTVKMGSAVKGVRFRRGYPAELEHLRDSIDRMGGPKAWPARGPDGGAIGVAKASEDGQICVAMPATALTRGTTLTLIRPDGRQSVLVASIVGSVSACEPLEEAMIPGPYYVAGPTSSLVPDPATVWVAFAGKLSTHRIGSGALAVRLDVVHSEVQVRSCTSHEGLHLTAWSGAPLTSRRLWHQYYYLGYDVEPSCDPREVGERGG